MTNGFSAKGSGFSSDSSRGASIGGDAARLRSPPRWDGAPEPEPAALIVFV
jgi:hypothetical protein